MKDYIKPSVSEFLGAMEGIDLKSGQEDGNNIDVALFWMAHDSGSYSVLSLALFHSMVNYTSNITVSGKLIYYGPDKMEFLKGHHDGIDGNVTMNADLDGKTFHFTVKGNNAQSQIFKLGVFIFKDATTGQLKDTRGDNNPEHRGAYMYSNTADPHNTFRETIGSSANKIFFLDID